MFEVLRTPINIQKRLKNGFITSVNYKRPKQSIQFIIESKFESILSKKDETFFCYLRPMPDVDTLMQEWPTQFEELLKEVDRFFLFHRSKRKHFRSFRRTFRQPMPMSIWELTPTSPVVKKKQFSISKKEKNFVFLSALLDVPVYESRVQSLHALFTLYLDFKNSEVTTKKNLFENQNIRCFFFFFSAFQSDDERF